MRALALSILPWCLLGWLPAQVPAPANVPAWTPDQVLQKLAVQAPDAVAWGAVRAAQTGQQDAVPALRAALLRFAATPGEPARYCRLALVDALVVLGATLTLPELTAHDDEVLRPALLVLAARDPERSRPYVEARFAATENSPDLEWRVCGNLLAAERSGAFALRCLQGLSFRLQLEVRDERYLGRSCGCYGSPTGVPATIPPHFPPLHVVCLDASNESSRDGGLRVVAHQRQFLRVEGQLTIAACDPQRAYRDWLVGYGAEHTATACNPELADVDRQERWRSAQQLRKTVARERLRIERLFAAMAKELVAAEVLPPAAVADLRPRFEVLLIDVRGEPGRLPLPSPAALLAR